MNEQQANINAAKLCEMTTGNFDSYHPCSKPAKYTIPHVWNHTGKVTYVCGIHAKGKNKTPIAAACNEVSK